MRTLNSHKYEFEYLQRTAPVMAFDKENPYVWKQQAKEKLTELLGLPLEKGACKVEQEYDVVEEAYRNIRFLVETEPGYTVPCHLLIPTEPKEKMPLTICLSGHGGGMHVSLGKARREADEKTLAEWPERAMGKRAVRMGRCALVIEARNFGESSLEGIGTSCKEAAKIAILMGRTVIGERVWDAMRILDAVLEAFPFIDSSDIACTGNSGGGTATYYLAAMDERITLAAPSCSVCTYEASIAAMPHCMCNHIPYIRKYFEMGDLAGLIAPRKLIVAAGAQDPIFPIDGVHKAFDTISEIYETFGVKEKAALVVGELGHLNYADLIWAKAEELI